MKLQGIPYMCSCRVVRMLWTGVEDLHDISWNFPSYIGIALFRRTNLLSPVMMLDGNTKKIMMTGAWKVVEAPFESLCRRHEETNKTAAHSATYPHGKGWEVMSL
jgi:hypothetical protein